MSKRLPSNWRSRIELVRRTGDVLEFDYCWRWIKGRTPRGWYREFGWFTANEDGYVCDVELETKFQGRGLGIAMYRRALQDNGFLRTKYHKASRQARRCWQSLVRDFRHKTDFWSVGGLLEVWYENGARD